MTPPRPLCAWCGKPLGRGAPPGHSASVEASWHARGLGVPTIGWHCATVEHPEGACYAADPLGRTHAGHKKDDLAEMLAVIEARGPGRLVRHGRRNR